MNKNRNRPMFQRLGGQRKMRARIISTDMVTDDGKDWMDVRFRVRLSMDDFKKLMDQQHFQEIKLKVDETKQKTLIEVADDGSA